MARADWGGGGELSGLFASLQEDWARRVEASVNRDISRSAEQQAASDADAYDKWSNGLMTDEEWLAYIHTRVDQTAGDPKEHEQWLETYRKHSTAIEDAQFEAAYNEGTMSINDLVAHYADRLTEVEKNSPAYRETEGRYFDLLDKRDSENIEDQASYILARINRGQAGYKELLNLYSSALSKVRSSSPLYRQLKQNIQSIQDVIDGVSGGSGGGSRSGGGSGGSGGGLSGDSYTRASQAVLKLWNSGNVFVPGGSDVVKSALDIYNVNTGDPTDVWNALAEDSVVIEQMVDYGQKNPNEPYMITPWGDKVPNTVDNRHLLMNQGLRGYDYRIALGNAQGRSVVAVLNARDTFVNNTFGAENSAAASDYWQQTRQNVWERFELASQNPDPQQALNEYAAAGQALEKAAHNILGEQRSNDKQLTEGDANTPLYRKSMLFPEEQVDDKMQEEARFAIELARFAKNSPAMSPEEAASEASRLFDSRPESFWLKESDLERVLGNDQLTTTESGFGTDYKVGTGIIGKSFASRGIMAADMLDSGQPVYGVEPFVYVGIPGQSAPMAVPISAANGALGVDDYKDGSTRGGWEKIGNKTVWVIRPLQPVKVPKWYYNDTNGRWLTSEQVAKFGRNAQAIADAGYTAKEIPQLAGWSKITDGDGREWYVDPEDGHLYPDHPPFKAGITGPVFDYADFVDKGGKLDFEGKREPASTAKGFIAFWTSDVSTREVQQKTEQMLSNPNDDRINLEYFHNRDGQNNVDFNPISADSVPGMFWSPSDRVFIRPTSGKRHGRGSGSSAQEEQRLEILERAELRRRAAVKDWTDKQLATATNQRQARNMLGAQAGEEGLTVGQFAQEQITKAAGVAGIRLGNRLPTEDSKTRPALNMPVAPSIAKPIAPVSLTPVKLREGPSTPSVPIARPIPLATKPKATTSYTIPRGALETNI